MADVGPTDMDDEQHDGAPEGTSGAADDASPESVRPVDGGEGDGPVEDPPRRRVEPDPSRSARTPDVDLPTVRISTSDLAVGDDRDPDEHPTRRTMPGERFGAVPVVRVDGPPPETIATDHPGHARLVPGGDDQTQEGGPMTNDDPTGRDDDRGDLGLSSADGTDFDSSEEAFVLPHWTEPPTGQVPKAVVTGDEAEEPVTGSQPRWRDERERTVETDFDDLRGDGPQLGALGGRSEEPGEDDFFSGETDDDPFQAFAPASEDDRPQRVSRRRREDSPERSSGVGRVRAGLGRLGRRGDEAPEGDAEGGDVEEQFEERVVADDEGAIVEIDETVVVDEDAPAATGGGGSGRSGGDRDLVTAVAVGVGLAALALVCFKLGGLATTILACVIVGVAAGEYFNVARTLLGTRGRQPGSPVELDQYFPTIVGLVGTVGLLLATFTSGLAAYPVVLPIVVVATLVWYLWVPDRPEQQVLLKVGLTLLGVVWIGVLGSFGTLFLGLGRQMQAADPALTSNPGIGVLIAAILASVASDVGGYFVGRSVGQTPLSAASPNKTVEGLIGGFITSVVAVVVVVGIVGIAPIGGSFPRVFVFALLCALVAPLGDLVESMVKRDVGIKDMGGVLPGHGGVLDRFDGLLFVLPVAYFATLLFDVWSVG